MNNIKYAFSFLFLTLIHPLVAQNLVPNPSFEILEGGCPTDFFQIYKAESWFSPDCAPLRPDTHGFAVLFNSCNYTNAGVPKNAICTQDARTGFSYAGIEVVSAYDGVYRQYIETMLTKRLEKGKKYYFSMYINLCEQYPDQPNLICYNTDSTGVFFSPDKIDKNPNCLALSLKPDVHSDLSNIKPGNKWHNVDGCYIAKGDERYITIGNFGGESISNCAPVNTLAYFIFIDDVNLFPEVKMTFDTTLCPNETWYFDATKLRNEYTALSGWKYLWSNGDTSSKQSFSKTATTKLTVSRKGCFNDVYDYNVKSDIECNCQIFVPDAFSPNGDGLNEIFLPQINCKTIEISNYSLSLFNRYGQRVFYSTDQTKGWDGKYKGMIHSNELFAWMIQYNINKGSGRGHKLLKGTLLSLR